LTFRPCRREDAMHHQKLTGQQVIPAGRIVLRPLRPEDQGALPYVAFGVLKYRVYGIKRCASETVVLHVAVLLGRKAQAKGEEKA
jgi:hypothetical protein